MESITYRLDQFEGPLDLLLTLISKNKVSITDIPIAIICDQYMEYINDMSEQNMEIAGEFLEMAAHLVYIKTVSLLPKHEEAEVMKKELQGRLIEYSLCKKAAKKLGNLFCGNDIFVRKQAKIKSEAVYNRTHEAGVLLEALDKMNLKRMQSIQAEPDSRFQVIIKHKMYSVTTKVIYILKQLYKTGTADMDGLYENVTDRSERVATFLAVLELTKSGRTTASLHII